VNRQRVAEELLAMADDLDAGVGERLRGGWKVSAYDVGGKTAWTWEDAKELISEARGR